MKKDRYNRYYIVTSRQSQGNRDFEPIAL
jgi:hypothetical protein